MKARIKTLTATFEGHPLLTLEIDDTLEHLGLFTAEFKGKNIDIDIKELKARRSLSANAYFHVLIEKMAKKLGVSNNYMKNKMLYMYGQTEILNGNTVILVVREGVELEEQEGLHAWLEEYSTEGEVPVKVYALMRGSRTYNTAEMARLIDGTVKEAEELGIPTLTPSEIARLR